MVDGAGQATAWQQAAEQGGTAQPGPGPGRQGGPRRSLAAIQLWLLAIFPVADDAPGGQPAQGRRRLAGVALQVAVLCAGAIVLLLRVGGTPAWDSVYAEDNGEFLVGALTHPWHLLVPYAGYEQLGPRLIGQLIASFLPLFYASDAYAVAGALIGSASALFIYHASDGYIRSRWLRAMLAAALVLLPLAPLDIIDSGVDSPWYPMTALFFAALWRPRWWPGMLAAALIAFYATSSEIVGIIYAPLLLIRLVALPRWREHAVTVGWLAGMLVQVPAVLESYTQGAQRLHSGHLSHPGQAVAFYFHNVVLRALGWRLSLHLMEIAGYNGATVIVGVILAACIAWAMAVGGRQVRLFAVVALFIGFIQTILTATITSYVNVQAPTWTFMSAARYSTIPIVLIDAIGILGVDAYLRRHGPVGLPIRPRARPSRRALLAAGVLVCVLGFGWVTDLRYDTGRTSEGHWRVEAQHWLHECERSRNGEITIPAWNSTQVTVACSRFNR